METNDTTAPAREANSWQIDDAFRVAGGLWGAEQADGDDEGVALVEKLTGVLRDFREHEEQEGDDVTPPCCGPCCC